MIFSNIIHLFIPLCIRREYALSSCKAVGHVRSTAQHAGWQTMRRGWRRLCGAMRCASIAPYCLSISPYGVRLRAFRLHLMGYALRPWSKPVFIPPIGAARCASHKAISANDFLVGWASFAHRNVGEIGGSCRVGNKLPTLHGFDAVAGRGRPCHYPTGLGSLMS